MPVAGNRNPTALWVEIAMRRSGCGRSIGRADTSNFQGANSVRSLLLVVFLITLPIVCSSKGKTARIEIFEGERTLLTLSDPQSAGQFNVWSGPGTSSGTRTSASDYADWSAGTVEPPANPDVYLVRFFCVTPGWLVPEKGANYPCYGVRYAIDRKTRQGYIQIPPARDPEFPPASQSIYRGVEGSWYRATARWESLIRPLIEPARVTVR
jgi:hypothetical protein